MTSVNTSGASAWRNATVRKGWRPGALAIALVVAWLALLAVPIVGLCNLDAFSAIASDVELKPWMPAYQPII